MVLGNVEVLIRFIIVVKNQNFQAYVCVFFVFPSSALSCRFSIFSLISFTFLIIATPSCFKYFQQPNFGLGDDEESEWEQSENAKSIGQRRGWKQGTHRGRPANKNLYASQNPMVSDKDAHSVSRV